MNQYGFFARFIPLSKRQYVETNDRLNDKFERLFDLQDDSAQKITDISVDLCRVKEQISELANRQEMIIKSLEDISSIILSRFDTDQSNNGELYSTNVHKMMWLLAGISSAEFAIERMDKARAFNNDLDLLSYALRQSGDGLYLEFGVYSGRTINHISSVCPDKIIFGFDSFMGLPETWRTGFEKGVFDDETEPEVNENVELVVGMFSDSINGFNHMHHGEKVAFIHCDCDLYSSAKTIFDELEGIGPSTVIVFDEFYNYPSWKEGEAKAFFEFVSKKNFDYEFIGYVPSHQQVAVILK